MCVVVGGGATARSYIAAGREANLAESTLDRLGIAASRLNARLLANILSESLNPVFVTDYEEAIEVHDDGGLPVMGGTTPGQTTDAVAAVLAEDVGANLVVYGTSTDGVYSADPEMNDDATRHDVLSHAELVELLADGSRGAGTSAPVGLLAAKLLERSETDAVVIDARDQQSLSEALRGEEVDGTLIQTDG